MAQLKIRIRSRVRERQTSSGDSKPRGLPEKICDQISRHESTVKSSSGNEIQDRSLPEPDAAWKHLSDMHLRSILAFPDRPLNRRSRSSNPLSTHDWLKQAPTCVRGRPVDEHILESCVRLFRCNPFGSCDDVQPRYWKGNETRRRSIWP